MTDTKTQVLTDQPIFINPSAMTLGTLIDQLPDLETDERRRQELASGIRTIARALETPPSAIPADPSYVGRLVRKVQPARHGLSADRWSNCLGLLRRAMALAGCQVMNGKRNHPLTPAWQQLMDALPSKFVRAQLSRFCGELSRYSVAPAAVRKVHFDKFRDALQDDSLLRSVKDRYQRTVIAWNKARNSMDEWPDVEAPPLPGREPYVKRLTDFSRPFQADVRLWLDRMSKDDLRRDSSIKPVRPATLKKWEFAIRQMASALVIQGHRVKNIRTLADLVRNDNAYEIVQFYRDLGKGRNHQAHGMTMRLKSIVRHHPGVNDGEKNRLLQDLRTMAANVAPDTRGMTTKNRDALRPFESEVRRRQLINLPARIFDELRHDRSPPKQLAIRLQTALVVGILLAAPMRAHNLARLEFDRHLFLREGTWWVDIPGNEVKNGQPIELPLPARIGKLLARYREQVLPALTDPTCAMVFPGENGRHKAEVTQAIQLKSLMARELGVKLSPHQFRHLVGYIYLLHEPHGHEVVRVMLGHRSIQTTIRFYAGMEGIAAAKRFDEVMSSLADTPGTVRDRRGDRPTRTVASR